MIGEQCRIEPRSQGGEHQDGAVVPPPPYADRDREHDHDLEDAREVGADANHLTEDGVSFARQAGRQLSGGQQAVDSREHVDQQQDHEQGPGRVTQRAQKRIRTPSVEPTTPVVEPEVTLLASVDAATTLELC